MSLALGVIPTASLPTYGQTPPPAPKAQATEQPTHPTADALKDVSTTIVKTYASEIGKTAAITLGKDVVKATKFGIVEEVYSWAWRNLVTKFSRPTYWKTYTQRVATGTAEGLIESTKGVGLGMSVLGMMLESNTSIPNASDIRNSDMVSNIAKGVYLAKGHPVVPMLGGKLYYFNRRGIDFTLEITPEFTGKGTFRLGGVEKGGGAGTVSLRDAQSQPNTKSQPNFKSQPNSKIETKRIVYDDSISKKGGTSTATRDQYKKTPSTTDSPANTLADVSKKEAETAAKKGFGVHGYSEGKAIGTDWYATRAEAEKAKASMERTETLKGKYYDKVEIKSETKDEWLFGGSRSATGKRDVGQTSSTQVASKSPADSTTRKPLKTNATVGQKLAMNEAASRSSAAVGKPNVAKVGGTPRVAPRSPTGNLASRTAPAESRKTVVTLHDGRKFSFDDQAKAKAYVSRINANPQWRAVMSTTRPQLADAAPVRKTPSSQIAGGTASANRKTVVTLHDGRTFSFNDQAAAKAYVNKINANPQWSANVGSTRPQVASSHTVKQQARSQTPTYRPSVQAQRPTQTYRPSVQAQRPTQTYRPSVQAQRPTQTYRPSVQAYRPTQTYRPSVQAYRPTQTYRPSIPTYRPTQTYRPSIPTYRPAPAYRSNSGSFGGRSFGRR